MKHTPFPPMHATLCLSQDPHSSPWSPGHLSPGLNWDDITLISEILSAVFPWQHQCLSSLGQSPFQPYSERTVSPAKNLLKKGKQLFSNCQLCALWKRQAAQNYLQCKANSRKCLQSQENLQTRNYRSTNQAFAISAGYTVRECVKDTLQSLSCKFSMCFILPDIYSK